jgi:hypothetical protein
LAWGGVCGLDSTVSGQGPVAGCCECGDEPSGSCATELVSYSMVFVSYLPAENEALSHVSQFASRGSVQDGCNTQ